MERLGLYIVVTGLAIGVFLSLLFTLTLQISVFLVLLSVTLKIVPQIVRNKNTSQQLQRNFGAIIWLCVLSVALGMFRVSLWQYFNHAGVLVSFANQKIELIGMVTEEPSQSENSEKLIVVVESVKHADTQTKINNERVLATVNRYETISYGDKIKLSGTLKIPKSIVEENGETFAYDKYLARQGIFVTMTFPQINIIESDQGSMIKKYLYRVKEWFIAQVAQALPYPESGLFTGLVISGKSGLGISEQELFTRVGIVHIVALSGANVTIIVQALFLSLFFVPKRWRLLIGALGIIGFTIMTGAEPTVVRAALMGLSAIGATLIVRTYDIGRALFIAAGVMIIYDPMIVFNMSFQLSFLATFALVFVTPLVLKFYETRIEKLPQRFGIREIIVSSLTIELFLLPLILYAIGETSVIALISNVFILPMLPIAMLTGFIAVMISIIHPLLALPVIALAYLSLGYILFIAKVLGTIPFALVSVSMPLWLMIISYICIGCWYVYLYKKVEGKTDAVTNAIERFNFMHVEKQKTP